MLDRMFVFRWKNSTRRFSLFCWCLGYVGKLLINFDFKSFSSYVAKNWYDSKRVEIRPLLHALKVASRQQFVYREGNNLPMTSCLKDTVI